MRGSNTSGKYIYYDIANLWLGYVKFHAIRDHSKGPFDFRQIIDLLATDKSRYFAQPRLIIVNCFGVHVGCSRGKD